MCEGRIEWKSAEDEYIAKEKKVAKGRKMK